MSEQVSSTPASRSPTVGALALGLAVATLTVGAAMSLTPRAPSVQVTVPDPAGDVLPAPPPPHDIISFSAATDGSVLVYSVAFNAPISPPNMGFPNAVLGYIDMDTDQNPFTGAPSNVTIFCPMPSLLGMDLYVNLSGYNPVTGLTSICIPGGAQVATAPVVFGPNIFTVTLSLPTALETDGSVNSAAVMGNPVSPTDCVPNGGFVNLTIHQLFLPLVLR